MKSREIKNGLVTVFQNGLKIVDKFYFTEIDKDSGLDSGLKFYDAKNNRIFYSPPGSAILVEKINEM